MPSFPTTEHLADVEHEARPTPRELAAVTSAATCDTVRPPSQQVPHSHPDPRAVTSSLDAEVRLLAMRVALLVRRVEELGQENESLRADVTSLLRKARPTAPYSSVAPTSEVVRIPDSKRSDSKLPIAAAAKNQNGT